MNVRVLPALLGGSGLALGLLCSTPCLAIATFSVEPVLKTVSNAETFTVQVKVSGVGDDPGVNDIIRGYDLLLGYDTSVLSANSVVFGSALGTASPLQYLWSYDLNFPVPTSYIGPHSPTMTIDFSQSSELCGFESESVTGGNLSSNFCPSFDAGPYLDALQPSAFVLATFSFTVNASAPLGTQTWLTLIDNSMIADPDEQFYDVKGNSTSNETGIPIALTDGQVQIPAPGTLTLLLGAGLAGGALHRRRRAQRLPRGA